MGCLGSSPSPNTCVVGSLAYLICLYCVWLCHVFGWHLFFCFKDRHFKTLHNDSKGLNKLLCTYTVPFDRNMYGLQCTCYWCNESKLKKGSGVWMLLSPSLQRMEALPRDCRQEKTIFVVLAQTGHMLSLRCPMGSVTIGKEKTLTAETLKKHRRANSLKQQKSHSRVWLDAVALYCSV